MLLENKSKLFFYAEIDLVFEDGSTKKDVIKLGDKVNLVFKHNGVRLKRQGTVTNIYPSRVIESQLYGSKKLSAVLELDCSTEYKAFSYKIDLTDILDIYPVLPDKEPECPGDNDNTDDDVWNDLGDLIPPENNNGSESGDNTDDDVWNDLGDLIPPENNNSSGNVNIDEDGWNNLDEIM